MKCYDTKIAKASTHFGLGTDTFELMLHVDTTNTYNKTYTYNETLERAEFNKQRGSLHSVYTTLNCGRIKQETKKEKGFFGSTLSTECPQGLRDTFDSKTEKKFNSTSLCPLLYL